LPEKKADKDTTKTTAKEPLPVLIDFKNIERRTIAMPLSRGNYRLITDGPAGTLFIGEQKEGVSGLVIQKYTLEKREAKEFISGASQISVSSDGNKMLAMIGGLSYGE
jgi:tricorn protease